MKSFLALTLCFAVTLATMPVHAAADSPRTEQVSPPGDSFPATGNAYAITAPDAHGSAILAGTFGLIALGSVISGRKKAKPFVGKLKDLRPGMLPGTGLKNGDEIHGLIESDEKGSERYVIDSHLGRIVVNAEHIDLDAADSDPAPRDYKDLKGDALDAELAARQIDGDGLKADEKRAALIENDKAKASPADD